MIIRSVIIREIALLHTQKISTDVFLQIIIIINSAGAILWNAVTFNTFEWLLGENRVV